MRSQTISVSSVASSAWLPVNHRQSPFNATVAVDLDSAAAGITYTVEHTFGDLGNKQRVSSITRSGTTVTVTFDSPHGLNTADSLIVEGTGVAGMDGSFTVTVTNTTVLTYTSGTSGTATGAADTRVIALRVWPHEFLAAKTTSEDSNYAYPVTAVRLTVTALTTGTATMQVLQGVNA